MRDLTLGEIVYLSSSILEASGGPASLRDLGALESPIAQPRASFGGEDLHVSAIQKAAAFCFSLVRNHPFLDDNKRVGHAAMETFLILNGFEIDATVDDQERIILLEVAAGRVDRATLADWLNHHVRPAE